MGSARAGPRVTCRGRGHRGRPTHRRRQDPWKVSRSRSTDGPSASGQDECERATGTHREPSQPPSEPPWVLTLPRLRGAAQGKPAGPGLGGWAPFHHPRCGLMHRVAGTSPLTRDRRNPGQRSGRLHTRPVLALPGEIQAEHQGLMDFWVPAEGPGLGPARTCPPCHLPTGL